MDVLSDVLSAVRLTGAIFFDITFHPPWAAETPKASAIAGGVMPEAEHVICFHVLLEGSCWAELRDDSSPPTRLSPGDIVVFPKDDQHTLCSSPGLRADPDLSLYHRPTDRALPYLFREGSGPDTSHFVCGYLGCDTRPFNPFLDQLPRMLHGRGSAGDQGWLAHLVRQAVAESEMGQAGGETILAKLAEVMFVEVIRQYVDTLPADARGWLSALRDPQVGAALRLVHSRPAEAWTLDGLAREVGLSRSVFAERFAHYVGVSPMHYLGQWRMQMAARRLERPGVSIAQAGAEIGYESEAAFSRAFKKYVGAPPGAWRKGRQSAVIERVG